MRVVKMSENEEQPSKQQSNALFLFLFLIFFAGGSRERRRVDVLKDMRVFEYSTRRVFSK